MLSKAIDGIVDELRMSKVDRTIIIQNFPITYTYNERNQLVTETTGTTVKTYSYDKNGNNVGTETKINTTVLATETLDYDELNRMLFYTGPRGTEAFTYRGAEWHRYTADGKTFLYDEDNVLADMSGGDVVATYVTPMLDQNLSMTQGTTTYYYSQDGLNSVRTLMDSTGALANNDPMGLEHAPCTYTSSTASGGWIYLGARPLNTNGASRSSLFRCYWGIDMLYEFECPCKCKVKGATGFYPVTRKTMHSEDTDVTLSISVHVNPTTGLTGGALITVNLACSRTRPSSTSTGSYPRGTFEVYCLVK